MELMMVTANFGKKIEEDRFGTMYHGKLRTGPEVAVKVWARGAPLAAEVFHQFETVRSPIS
jgi:hypothetical protein